MTCGQGSKIPHAVQHSQKKKVMKILKGLRKAIERNSDYCEKEIETIRRRHKKSGNSFAENKGNE